MDERKVKVEGQLGFSLDLSEEQFKVLHGDDTAAAKALLVELIQVDECKVCELNHIVGDTRYYINPYLREGTLCHLSKDMNKVADELQEVPESTEDELISREALKDVIQSHFGRDLLSYASDWLQIWVAIDKAPSENGDLISRNSLLDEVMNLFGCDLAYYGKGLQFFQEAIQFAPAISSVKVEDLIANASERSAANKQDKAIKLDVDFGKM